MDGTPWPLIAYVVALVVATLGWLVVVFGSMIPLGRMPSEARAQVPLWVWIPYATYLVGTLVWPIGILASVVVIATGSAWLLRGPREARAAGWVSIAAGLAYLGVVAVAAVGALLVFPTLPG